MSSPSVDMFIGKNGRGMTEWAATEEFAEVKVCLRVSADCHFSMVLLSASSDSRKHSWGGVGVPFINSLFILNLLISCCFCSLTKRSSDAAASHPSARGEREIGGMEWEREGGRWTEQQCWNGNRLRREGMCVRLFSGGMLSRGCFWGRQQLCTTSPRIRCSTKLLSCLHLCTGECSR